jgi:hypothetical protein
LVHLVLRGFFFFLNAFLHLDRQNLKIFNKNLSQEVTMLDLIRRSHLAVISNKNHSVARPYIWRTKVTFFNTHFDGRATHTTWFFSTSYKMKNCY